ncbi:purple acid phosphatase family protein [Spirosoma sp.]|uniref:purple acid phosphatase family protein n=1 Tax=Spirosoma sp. TaxID=1899569 RepID=UPI003B3ACEB8
MIIRILLRCLVVLVYLTLLSVTSRGQSVLRSPYLQAVTPTGITIRWRTDQPTNSRVRFGASLDQLNQQITDATFTTEHIVTLTGLQPSTRYYYSIGSTAGDLMVSSDQYFQTSPPAGTAVPVRIWALGDFGSGTANQLDVLQRYRQATQSRPADIWLWLGDNAYGQGTDLQYQQNVFTIYTDLLKHLPFWPTAGNHEYVDVPTNLNIDYFNIITVPQEAEAGGIASGSKLNYSFDYANVHIISMDSEGNDGTRLYDTTGRQAQWLKQDLAANQLPWTIVFFHHPPYSKGSRDSDFFDDQIQLRQKLVPILERYNVDLVLSGHSHVYERTYLLKGHYGSATTFNLGQHAVSTSTARYDGSPNSCPISNKQTGTIYVVAGSGGQLGGQATGYPHPAMVYANNQQGGSMLIDVNDNRLDAQWVASDGTVKDRFTMIKQVNRQQTFSINPNESLTLRASWPGDYVWNTGQTSRTITVSPTVSTTYTVSDPQGCLTDTYAVNVDNQDLRFEGQMVLYPNPANNSATMRIAVPTPTTIDVQVTTAQGAVVFQKQYVNTSQVQEAVTLTGPGLYWFTAKVGPQLIGQMSFTL